MNRRAVLIAAAAAAVVLVGWYLLLFSPTKSDLDKAKKRTEAAKTQSQQLEAEIARLRSAQRSEPARRAQLEQLRTAIPDTPNLAQFILDVNDAAAKSGIDFVSIAPTEPKAATPTSSGGGVTPTPATTVPAGGTTPTTTATVTGSGRAPAEITVQLQIIGGYFQVLDFLNRLDRLPRLVVTDAINISADNSGRLTAGVNGRIFVRTIPAGFAGATATTSTTSTTVAGAGASTTASTSTTVAGGTP